MMNLNLLPSKAKFQAAKIKMRHTVISSVLYIVSGWLLVFLIVISLNIYINYQVDAATNQLNKTQKNYLGLSDNILTSQRLKYRAKAVGGVLSDRFEYGKAFERVQNLFPAEIKLMDYDLREDGTFLIEGSGSGRRTLDLLENLIYSINRGENENVTSAKLTTLLIKGVDWNFNLEVVLK